MKPAHRASLVSTLVVVLFAALGLAGCGASSDGSGSTVETSSSEPSQSALLEDLGIELVPTAASRSGVLVHSLLGNGAHTLLRSGDLIVTVNDERVESVADVDRALRGIEIGDSLALTVARGSRRLNFTEVLSPVAYLGANVQDRKGRVIVVTTNDPSPAAAAGLQRGDAIVAIDGKPMATVSELLQTLGTYSPGDKITVEVSRGERRIELEATLAERPTSNGTR
jgi:S1-C subfamily serine protease